MSDTPSNAPNSEQPQRTAVPITEVGEFQPIYTNFVRVAGTPEELVLDFGLNTNSPGSAPQTIRLTERVVMNYFTAKRTWQALGIALQRHEQAFGVLETDINKRAAEAAKNR